jgi:subtilisin family serine protease/subtilisin-like proprotein convertase family protein
MRQSRRLSLAVALVALVLGVHRWVLPPSSPEVVHPHVPVPEPSSAIAAKVPANGEASQTAVGAASAKRLRFVELARGERPNPGDTNFPWRAQNTSQSIGKLLRDPHALLLRNALIDTASAEPIRVPEGLASGSEGGFHLVQSVRELDSTFRDKVEAAGLRIISYIPNNALLVQGSDVQVERLAMDPEVAAIPAWQPAFKLDPELLTRVIDGRPLEVGERLMISVTDPTALDRLASTGVREVTRQRSPFGLLVTVETAPDSLVILAQSPDVHLIEKAARRELLNDRSGYLLGSSTDITNRVSYDGLTGSNVVVNVNDSGIDWKHPDLTTNRVSTVGSQTNLLTDFDGHGTHVAGTIAGSGEKSLELTGPAQGSVTNASFRGHAPGAKLFILPIDLQTGPTISDAFLQEQAAKTNALISNNSWGYVGAYDYNSISASYDAASRDALPDVSGEQPVLFVFAAGNSGGGGDNGVGGFRGTVSVPGNAKNVITVGALESRRNLTNAVVLDEQGRVIFAGGRQFRVPATNATLRTNLVFRAATDTDTEVAGFSSRGNVGVGIEGEYGRFKPDVVAPGTQIISARSSQWDLANEYDTNSVQYAVFGELNQPVGPWYRFLSGTSMAAPAVSGLLAQIQEFWHRPNRSIPSYLEAAAYKAFVINSARSTSDTYSPDFRAVMNYSGWGQPNLQRALDSGVREISGDGTSLRELAGFAGELFTGSSYFVRLRLSATDTATNAPFRFTLVWTDPPGNPAAGIKLVNDLDLVVSNTVTGEVFVGNDLSRAGLSISRPGTNLVDVVEEGVTNSVFDSVNNVERVLLPPPLASEYVIQVIARRVNVNALASRLPGAVQNRTNILQDFVVALSSDAATNNAVVATAEFLSSTTAGLGVVQPSPITVIQTNGIPVAAARAGANSPLFGGLNGQSNQWHFFVFTNRFDTNAALATGLTNGRFVEFNVSSAVNLARPRGTGATGRRLREPSLGPDLDLFVSRDRGLTNLVPAVVGAALRSARQGGEERIEITNAPANGEVYYIGVKAEDQQAGEFELIVRSSDQPFSTLGSNGYEIVMTPVGGTREIPNGSPDNPGVIRYFGTGPGGLVRNVTLIQSLFHQNFLDLQGTLVHQGYGVTVNNRRAIRDLTTGLYFNSGNVEGLYDDVPGLRFPNGQPSDGPSTTLLDFSGLQIGGSWNYLLQDDVLGAGGSLNRVQVQVQPQIVPAFDEIVFENICLGPRGYDFRFRQVPPDASRFIVQVTNMVPAGLPLEIYIRREAFPDPANPDLNDRVATITSPGGVVSISARDVPPLQSGFYFVLFHNPSSVQLCFDVALYGERNLSGRFTRTLSGTATNLSDVARSIATIRVDDGRPVGDVDVAVRVEHQRVSDLALRLEAPSGLGALLFENRGLTTTNGLGGVLVSSNFHHVALTLDRISQRATLFFNGESVAEGVVPRTLTNQATAFQFGYSPSGVLPALPVRLDDLGVWRRPLREDEIRRIFDEGFFGRGKLPSQVNQGLVSLWQFDGNGIDLINGSDADWTPGSVSATEGQVGRGLLFPGGTAGGRVTNASVARVPSQIGFTLDGWVRPDSGNESIVVAGWFNEADNVFGPALLVGQAPPFGNGPGSVSAVFRDPSGALQVIASAPGLFTASGLVTNRAFAVFSDRTNGAYTPIKFARPPYLSRAFPATVVSNDWETVNLGDYAAGTNLIEGWEVLTNSVEIKTSGGPESLVLDLRNGSILSRFDLNVGQPYTVFFTTRSSPLSTNPVAAEVRLDDVLTRRLDGTSDWVTNRAGFVAGSDRVPVEIRAILPDLGSTNLTPGLELGRVWIDQAGTALTYQPEEPIRPLLGRPGTGDWRLSLTDARGDISGALIDWQLRITFMPTNTPAVRLTNGLAYTTNLIGDDPRYFIVDVPFEAERATNLLENLSGGPLFLLYSETGLPDLTEASDVFLAGPVLAGTQSVSVLNTNLPPLLPRGQRYYLAVRSFDAGASNVFSIRTDFGVRITPLTNGVSVVGTNTNPAFADYYSYEVSTNSVLGVTFSVTGASGDVDLVAIRAPLLPRLDRYDYLSSTPGLSNEVIAIDSTSSPVPLTPGLWYLGVVNVSGVAPLSYTVTATEPGGIIRRLTPGTSQDLLQDGLNPDYFFLDVPDNSIALRVSLRSLDEDLLLTGRRGLPLPTSLLFDAASDHPGTADEDILLTATSSPVALSAGRWFFQVSSPGGLPSGYSIGAELRQDSGEIYTLFQGFGFLSGSSGGPVVQEFFFPNPGPVAGLGFEIYDLFGEADLTVSPDAPIPVALTTYSNPRPGTASELVVVRAGADTNSLARDWYLRVTVPGTNSLTYRVRVNIESGGILPIGSPLVIQPVIGTNGVISLLNWQAIPGEVYRVDFADSLAAPIRWNPLSTNTATTDFLSVPILGLPSAPERYLRTVQIPRIP